MTWSKEALARNLRYYIKLYGLTQRDIAKIAGVSAPTVSEWLAGKKYPRIDRIERLADYFGILKSDLIEDSPKGTTPPTAPDIAAEVESILAGLDSERALSFDGGVMDDTTRQLLRQSLGSALETARIIAKNRE